MNQLNSLPDTLRSALKLAKNGAFDEAQVMAANVDKDGLSAEHLRTLALVYSYCGCEDAAEQIWERVCAQDDVGMGDYFMLASTQISLGHADQAVENLEREIAAADSKRDYAYLSVSAINLAFLLLNKGRKREALDVLGRVDSSESTYIHGAGLVTKNDLLRKLK